MAGGVCSFSEVACLPSTIMFRGGSGAPALSLGLQPPRYPVFSFRRCSFDLLESPTQISCFSTVSHHLPLSVLSSTILAFV
jgi:hypothetical protein